MRQISLLRTLILVCAAVLLAASAANAAFDYDKAKNEAEKAKEAKSVDLNATAALKNTKGYSVTQLGSGTPKQKNSFGKEMALSRALKIITPDEWATTAGPHGEKVVSWQTKGGQTWIDALEQLGRKYGLRFVVDWKNRCVMVPAEDRIFADAENPSPTSKQVGEGPEKKWELEPGSLKRQLTEWAERAGYSVVWNGKHDYRISADATFKGDFTKAVTDTIEALYRNGARISVDIYQKNKVLYISPSNDED